MNKRGDNVAIINKVSLDDCVIGNVLDINTETRHIAVYIPKFMPGIAAGNSQVLSTRTNTSNVAVSNIEISSQIKTRNSIWIQARDFKEALPKIGSKVSVWIIDGNLKTAYWSPFNPNNNYEVLDEEKYNTLFNLQIQDTLISLSEEDTLIFDMPNSMSVVYSEDNKFKTIKITQENNYIVSESRPANPTTGMMWFKISTEELWLYKNEKFSIILTEAEIDAKIAAAIV